MKLMLRKLADLFLGGAVQVAPPAAPAREIQLPPFHPIIFANGRDDDTEGLKAFFEGRPVILFGRVIGEGDAVLDDLELRSHATRFFMLNSKGHLEGVLGFPFSSGQAIKIDMRHNWQRTLRRCSLSFNCPVQP